MKNTFRTSNNVFRTQVQNYIINQLTPHCSIDIPESLEEVVESFKAYDSPYNQKRIPNKQARFIDFLQGLPSTIAIDFENAAIEEILEEWFTACEQPYKPKPNYTDHFYYFVADNFQRLCKKYHVDF